jgi:hypothetical protein
MRYAAKALPAGARLNGLNWLNELDVELGRDDEGAIYLDRDASLKEIN